jgi:hypothetical protein
MKNQSKNGDGLSKAEMALKQCTAVRKRKKMPKTKNIKRQA